MRKALLLLMIATAILCGWAQQPPVCNLELQVGGNDTVSLSWDLPDNVDEVRLSWSNEDIDDVLFSPGGVVEQVGANRFEPTDLENFVGWTIKEISFVPWTPSQEYGIKIWSGQMDSLTLLCHQSMSEYVPETWNTCNVDEDIAINEGVEYWIGCYAVTASLILGVNMNIEDVVPWKSDLWRTNGMSWFSLYELGLWNNVCISATLASPEVSEAKLGNRRGEILTGYRVYRNDELIAEIPRTFQTYFTDTEFSKNTDVEYCVTAVYRDEESEPVCATASITGVGEATMAYVITIAPNPTNGQVTVMGKNLRRAEVVNMLGQHIISVSGAGDELQIDMAGLPNGGYFIEIADAEGMRCVKKVMKE